MMGFGVRALSQKGDLFYTNWFGELVFELIATALGVSDYRMRGF
jgi:hypothetical protein